MATEASLSEFFLVGARLLCVPTASDSEVRRLLAVVGEDTGESIIAWRVSPETDLGRGDELEE
jgi:hypothetical protein